MLMPAVKRRSSRQFKTVGLVRCGLELPVCNSSWLTTGGCLLQAIACMREVTYKPADQLMTDVLIAAARLHIGTVGRRTLLR